MLCESSFQFLRKQSCRISTLHTTLLVGSRTTKKMLKTSCRKRVCVLFVTSAASEAATVGRGYWRLCGTLFTRGLSTIDYQKLKLFSTRYILSRKILTIRRHYC